MLEVTIRLIKNAPAYILRGKVKLDFVSADNIRYLYTDIGKK